MVSVCPMSMIVLNDGCLFGSHMTISGSMSNGASTAVVGCRSEFATASSVASIPIVMVLSRYICAETCPKPIAGPPARISSRTPVSIPRDTSGPTTRLRSASTR